MNESNHPDTRAGSLTLSAVLLAALSYWVLLAEKNVITFFAGREMFFEMAGALFFLLASLACLGAFLKARRAPKAPFPQRKLLYLALTLFFFVALGEEISWGQMIFGFAVPENIAQLNEQKELNLHNLKVFDTYSGSGRKSGWRALVTSNRLFDYFMIAVFLVGPWAYRFITPLRDFLDLRGIRAVARIFAVALAFNVALSVVGEVLTSSQFMHRAISEIREFNYAYLCFVGFFSLFLSEPVLDESVLDEPVFDEPALGEP